ncbi:hypothetical protein A2757_02815 [Candidatus Giovannonibacteria bacterium RIFCSPHIGHO2_01_FULL_48_47]|nr:MAG: hypothetical protein A2757_02815 [Candidatus Giovannonibacteria bacterium RIFCSPHIGHO2_01_FULL_48_47]OGF68465.1 MAG: hypothetical protein A3D61_00255 [Candidatus Giovannonibacteria bacterium RIFCSPHIGHO2_02_FULL_48_15]OGF88667.1 MAG: hypothetical protein A3B26_03440 [Candidatus Giovannonibacteria bacterium RIFCSPLOWO2_01_FULL_48_47]OGF94587.1 MAG: hypothetical protein A2433_03205 [Candidatus Giovannonibacteria bacterium RIFOXYC1_FULL_48_8]OGF95936.1 MAG: hypothetical protein A2613_03935
MPPRQHFKKAKDKILGKKYELDLVFADSKTMLRLNKTYRRKNKAADVLAFALSPKLGQIFLNRELARKKERLWTLYLHGLLHLKGFRHGPKMEALEKKFS